MRRYAQPRSRVRQHVPAAKVDPPRPRRDASEALSISGDVVKIFFGPERHLFPLPRSIATSSSKRFQRELENNQRQTHIFRSNSTWHDLFKIYQNWLYTRTIVLDAARYISVLAAGSLRGEALKFADLLDLHTVGAYLEDNRFQDSVLDAFIPLFNKGILPGKDCIEEMLEVDDPERKLRILFAEAYAKFGNKMQLEALRNTVPADFLTDVCLALCDIRNPGRPKMLVRSKDNSFYDSDEEGCVSRLLCDAGRPRKRARRT